MAVYIAGLRVIEAVDIFVNRNKKYVLVSIHHMENQYNHEVYSLPFNFTGDKILNMSSIKVTWPLLIFHTMI